MTEEPMSVTPTNERPAGPVEPLLGALPLGAPTALEALHARELDVQIATARRYPRSLATFRARALTMVRLDPETAASCFYSLPRRQRQDDGSVKRITITGPSVRLAEIAASCWGNIRAGARVVAESATEVIAQGYCHDLETNYAQVKEVNRAITDRGGRRYSDDMVTTTKNAACAIAGRNAILAVIPRAFVNPLLEEAKRVVAGQAKSLVDLRSRAVAAYAELGVSAAQLCEKLERRGLEDLDLEDLTLLSGLLTALKERETSVDDEFPKAAPASPTTTLQETVARRRRVLTPEAPAEPSTSPDTTKPS
jgi:hypothetical protein